MEIIPSKLVFTIKAGPNGGKRKTRWVICGNYESKKESEQTFVSGADAAAFRLSIWAAARHQWAGAVIDIKAAFLNALMDQGDQEAILIVRPPALFTGKATCLRMFSLCLKERCMVSAVLQDCGVRAAMRPWKASKSRLKMRQDK